MKSFNRTYSIWQHSFSQQISQKADVIIVGGGIAGVSSAYWLKQLNPHLSILLLEAETLAFGASGRNAGFILQGSATNFASEVETFGKAKAQKLWQITKESRQLMLDELNPEAFDARVTGSFIAAGSEVEAQQLSQSEALLHEIGENAVYFDEVTANRQMEAHGFHGALFVPTNGQLNPIKLVRHIAEKAQGVQVGGKQVAIFEHCRVLEVLENGALQTNQGIFSAPNVIFCLNAYLPQLMPEFSELVKPKRAQMAAFREMKMPSSALYQPSIPPIYSHDGFFYLRTMLDGTLLIGGARHLHLDEEVGYDDTTTEALQNSLQAYIRHHFPKWASRLCYTKTQTMNVSKVWSGTMGFSPDYLPIVCEMPKRETTNLYWLGAFSGHGLGFGFRLAKMLAERIVHNEKPAEWELFSIERF